LAAGTLSARIRRCSVAHSGAGMGLAMSIVVPAAPRKVKDRRQKTESNDIRRGRFIRASEIVLHGELHDARIARRRDAPEGRSRKRRVRVIQQEPVERVEGLEPRLEAMTVGEPEQAYERQIDDV